MSFFVPNTVAPVAIRQQRFATPALQTCICDPQTRSYDPQTASWALFLLKHAVWRKHAVLARPSPHEVPLYAIPRRGLAAEHRPRRLVDTYSFSPQCQQSFVLGRSLLDG